MWLLFFITPCIHIQVSIAKYIFDTEEILFMAIAVASISTYVYKYVIHKIAISCAAQDAISAQIMERRHRLLSRSTLYFYLYCIYFVL